MSFITKTVLWVLLAICIAMLLGEFIEVLQYDLWEYEQAGNCIAKHIANGVERSEILTLGEKCYLKSNPLP